MTWGWLIACVLVTIVLGILIHKGALREYAWAGWLAIFIVWFVMLLSMSGVIGRIGLNERVGSLVPGLAPAQVVGVVLARGVRYDAPDHSVGWNYS